MDYERIGKPQGGGLSPSKLRNMLLRVEKKRKEEEKLESVFSLRSEQVDVDESVVTTSENCKDVIECSTSTTTEVTSLDMTVDQRFKELTLTNYRIRSLEDNSVMDYDSGHESASVSSAFEFQKAERAPHRVPFAPFSKPAPSKWDDAQKWIASPTSNRQKSGQSQLQNAPVGLRKTGVLAYGNRQSATKVVVEIPDKKIEEADTKRIDLSQAKKDSGGQKHINWAPEPYPMADACALADSAMSVNRHDSSASVHSATAFIPPPSTVRSVSMRDMGTEMTPITSQEPSRNGTPVRATTPTRSPNSSRPSTPGRPAVFSSPVETMSQLMDSGNKELSEKELQKKTKMEIMALGTQLGKMNIAAWASKEEEDEDASASLKTLATEQSKLAKSVVEARAAAWEEAEKAKYTARYKREEIKIQAWENHQKAKTEAEMRKIEVEVERMRARAHDKLMNKLAAARHKAEEKRAAAEAKRNRQAAKTEQQAEYIRKTGLIPSSFSCCTWCF
ncbi:hypothetical protein H6P81_018209 [Aristolochia fimbriata]|uniref:Remorin C-terminal domain-containing protein n=1 Tax=Aristolochia fimbriata TaxID=158543 RepID=A0AAV7E0G5_ARIFI|nr:hypothetical protein H6P81_018209 [Aristolochia fimbriata]